MITRPPEWPWQKDGRVFLKRGSQVALEREGGYGAGLAFKPGRGKTRPTIREIQRLHRAGQANLVLIVNTLSGMHVWVNEWPKCADVPALFIDLREHGSDGIRKAKALADAGNLVVCVVNYESAWKLGYKTALETKRSGAGGVQQRKVRKAVGTTLHDVEWDVAVLDEIHKIATPGSVVSKFFRTLVAPKCRVRIGLTGSLITKNPGKAWAPVKFLTGEEVFPGPYSGRPGPDREGHAQKPSFLSRYAIINPYIPGGMAIDGWQNLDDFSRRLAKAFYVPDESQIEQRDAVHVYRKVELSAASRKKYDALTKNLYLELETWEGEGRVEYLRMVEYLRGFWPEELSRLTWDWPDDVSFRSDVEANVRGYMAYAFLKGSVWWERADDEADTRAWVTVEKVKKVVKGETVVVRRRRLHIAPEAILSALTLKAKAFHSVTLEHVFSVMRKQGQIANGFIVPDAPDDDPTRKMEPIELGTEKLDELGEELDKWWVPHGSAKMNPVVVVVTGNYEQARVVEYIRKRYGFDPKVLDGSVQGAARRFAMVAAAAYDPVFVLKAQAGSESIDCQWAQAFIIMSKTPNTVQYEQLLARMLRGERMSGTYVHIVALGTVDERIEEILSGDLNLAKRVEKDWRKAIVA